MPQLAKAILHQALELRSNDRPLDAKGGVQSADAQQGVGTDEVSWCARFAGSRWSFA